MRVKNDSWVCSCGNTRPRETDQVTELSSGENEDKSPSPVENQANLGISEQIPSKESTANSDHQQETNLSDIDELRQQAKSEAVDSIPETATANTSESQEYSRSQAIVKYVKSRAGGICEGCGEPAPFISNTGRPYLHAHHIHELSSGGSDTPDTVVALCPNCHYRVHHGTDGERFNQKLLKRVQDIESEYE